MNFFDYKTDFDVDAFLEEAQESQKQRIENELEQLQNQLENRDQLHEETLDELESKKNWYVDRLETLYQRGIGTQGKRKTVKNRIESLYQQIRKERRSHWHDRQTLERERRKLLRELTELDDEQLLDVF